MADPERLIIPCPIKSNHREGLSVLECFTATYGARKGLADTAFRTVDSGYLTRCLVDVSQDAIVHERDRGTRRGLLKVTVHVGSEGVLVPDGQLDTVVYARTLARDISDVEGNVIVPAGTDLGDVTIEKLIAASVTDVSARSVLTCESRIGTYAMCYGRSMAIGKLVDIGEVVGIVAAQSIDKPGTQLTVRTFHTGGSASADDIIQGLPRVQELFEARTPKGEASIAESAGHLKVEDGERTRRLIIVYDDGDDDLVYQVPKYAKLLVPEEGHASVGQQLVEGSVDPKRVLRISGRRAAQEHIVNKVQSVYRSQGVKIHDKHIGVIVRQMLRRAAILKAGTTKLLPGELVDVSISEDENRAAMPEGGKPALGRPEPMGIAKASLVADSWLSAASFWEMTKVLIEATLNPKSDPLSGLKENAILDKLISAGIGLEQLCSTRVEPTSGTRTESEKNNGSSCRGLEAFDDGLGYNGFPDFDLSSGHTAF